MLDRIEDFITSLGVTGASAHYLALAAAGIGVILLAMLAFFIARYLVVRNLTKLIAKSDSKRDDAFAKMKVFTRASRIAPALVFYVLGPRVFAEMPEAAELVRTLSLIYLTIAIVLFIDALINAGQAIYKSYPISRTFPVTSFVQVAKLVLYFFGIVTILSLILGESPLTFLAGLGALTAVLMLVFKDPILGFVAGIQLSANKMVAVGDWVEMTDYGADGDIMEIGLTTVKIRNFDKTVTTIPTQALINDSFKNWRGMQEAGGRRIKRAIHIDVGSIKFCDDDMLERFARVQHISEYITAKSEELKGYNSEAGIDTSARVNGRKLTNIGTFRAYVEAYLRAHPRISDRFTLLVRQLAPGEAGVPIEVYVFTDTTDWIEYEAIQADIFDHLLAAVPEFDLRLFQHPTGGDFALNFAPGAETSGAKTS